MTNTFHSTESYGTPTYGIFRSRSLHFEGHDEIRLEGDESVWSNAEERDTMLDSINQWQDR
ncbi:MAG: hypothetical protein VX757_03445 [Planctomycetota bacterium]|nr:hypothetical protein [Planctomycetota bacterium]